LFAPKEGHLRLKTFRDAPIFVTAVVLFCGCGYAVQKERDDAG
jgi:hypothetical protein